MITNVQRFVRRVRLAVVCELFLAVFLVLIPAAAMAQTLAASPQEVDQKLPRKTPLATQVAPEKAWPILPEAASPEPAGAILQRTASAHNNDKMIVTGMVAEGTVTVYTPNGPQTFPVTLIQDGEHGSQRIQLRQPDGKLWDGRIDHLASGGGRVLGFLQTQYERGLQNLMNVPKRSANLTDNGIRNASRVVTVMEQSGDSTKYNLDPATSRVTRFEYMSGLSRDSVGNVSPIVESFAFADVRTSDGVATPFHIEHSVNGVKQEELQLTNAHYGSNTTKAPAVPPDAR
jgi:hypothetical protein